MTTPGWASFQGVRATGVLDHVDLSVDPARLDGGGFWAVAGDFEGRLRAWRFAEVDFTAAHASTSGPSPAVNSGRGTSVSLWRGPDRDEWRGSLDRDAYLGGVAQIRAAIREGDVYQVNLCRVLSAPLPGAPRARDLAAHLAVGNPAPYGGALQVEAAPQVPPVWVVSASPELFLRVRGAVITSSPIKGTATGPAGLTEKDRAENIMITDLVRNDLQRVCVPGTVEVTDLLAIERHPGLAHLVSTVQGRLRAHRPDWRAILTATYPPASVSGAPKQAALGLIGALEPVARGPYCGAFGWIDADAGRAELAVGIRTFWWTDDDGGTLRFGTGAGITWGSNAEQEWAETELKAERLVGLASQSPAEGSHVPGATQR